MISYKAFCRVEKDKEKIMRKKSIWVLIGMLIATVAFAVAGCKNQNDSSCVLSETSISLTLGEEKQLSISPVPKGAVSWESDDGDVATVSQGLVSAVGEGSATVTAKIEGVKTPLTCTVTVTEVPIEINGYRLDFSSVSLKTGETMQISVVDEEGNPAGSVSYSSADSAIASVSESGLITAVSNGETLIRAQIEGGTLVCKVTVAQAYSYSLDKTSVDLAVGAIGRLTLITTPGGNASNRPHTFSSSDESIVTVNGGTGKLTGVAKGEAVITCLVDGQELKANVTVTKYTVMIGEEIITDEMSLLLGTETDITITADPAREISAKYESSDESIVTVADGRIVPHKTGTATISVTVGGKEFKTAVTVESGYDISHKKVTLALGATDGSDQVQLEVTHGDEAQTGVAYSSSDEYVATVSQSGLVTAKGYGTAVITSRLSEEVVFETTVSVVPYSSLGHKDFTFGSGAVNLTYLDANKTIDWRQWHTSESFPTPARMKNNADLIGDCDKKGNTDEGFWDYKAPVLFEDADGANSFGAYTYGKAIHGSFSIPVKVTNEVAKIVILTGSWKETATIRFKLGDIVLQSETFVGGENALARKYELSINTQGLKEGESLDLTIEVDCNREHSGNVSLVSVAVVGKEAHEHRINATSSANVTTGLTGVQNLTETGSVDWLAADGTRKTGVPADTVINESGIAYGKNAGQATDYPGATFTWTDGTAAAPASYRTFKFSDTFVVVPVLLFKGESTVTVYTSGWNCGYLVAVYDGNGNFIDAYQVADEKKMQSVSGKAEIVLNVDETGEYVFKIMKCRGAGNSGWAAISVSGESDIVPAKSVYSLVKDGNNQETIVLSGTASSVTYASGDTAIATVDSDGKITAVNKGKTYITISDGKTERRVYVTVTEYTLASSESLTLSIGATSQIEISADPSAEFTAEYNSSDDSVVTVDAKGKITAVSGGDAKITATVGGKSFEIQVKVEGYQISDTKLTLHAGKNTQETKTLSVTDGSGNAVSGVVFASSNEQVATVNEDTGLVTAIGVGTAVITAHIGSANITCEVTVAIPDPTSELTELDMAFENLSRVSNEYKTIDYKHWNSAGTVEMDGRETLIGEPSSTTGNFWDYKTAIGYEFKTGSNRNLGMCYGKTSNGFRLPVTVNNLVSEIVFYTGAYNGTATVTFKLGDRVLASKSFTASEGIARKIVLKLDTDKMLANDTLIIEGSIEKSQENGNINVVAVAVVGKTAYSDAEVLAGTGSATAERIEGEKGSNKVNLTEVGSLDWIYSHYENPNDQTFRKFGGSVLTGETYYNNTGAAAEAGREWDGFTAFNWTDGIRSDLIGTEGAAAGNNPVDNDIAGGGDYTNNYNTATGEIHIAMNLAAGKYVVKAYLNSWRADICSALYDGNHNFVAGKLMICNEPSDGSGWVVTYTIDVTQESTFNLVIGKSRSHDASDRKVGWQAVAVAEISE